MSTEEIISNLKKFLWCYSKSYGSWTLSAPMESKRLHSWIGNHISDVRQKLGDMTVLFVKKTVEVLKWKVIPEAHNRGISLRGRVSEWMNERSVSPHAHPSSSWHHNYPELILQYNQQDISLFLSFSLTVQSRAYLSHYLLKARS